MSLLQSIRTTLLCAVLASVTSGHPSVCEVDLQEESITIKPVTAHMIPFQDWVGSKSLKIQVGDTDSTSVEIATYHVSCKSDSIQPHKNYAGVVFYALTDDKQGVIHPRTKYTTNGLGWSPGYIYIAETTFLAQRFPGESGLVHGAALRQLFGVAMPSNFVGAGFSIQNGKYKWNSYSQNAAGAHKGTDNLKRMHHFEIFYARAAVERWRRTHVQNHKVEKMLADSREEDLDAIDQETGVVFGDGWDPIRLRMAELQRGSSRCD